MKISGTTLVLAAILAALVYGTVFTVNERELAIKLRFSEIVASDYEPGLHFKFPYVNSVRKFPKRLLTINNPTEKFLTAEKKNLVVDFFIKWRITDVDDYYTATAGDQMIAENRLLAIITDGIRAEFVKRTVQEVVSSERREIMADMLNRARESAEQIGIDVVDVRVKRIEFADEVVDSVFDRMRQERSREASRFRAEGVEEAEQIRAGADRERTVILADAYRDAEVIRGEGDAAATKTYAEAFEADAEFYSFYRSIEAYKRSLGTQGDLMVLGPDSEFLRYLNESQGGK